MSVLIATPCYGGLMHIGLFRSLIDIAQMCGQAGVNLNFLTVGNESAITRGRSNIASTFLRTDYQTLAMIDADIEVSGEDFMRLLRLEKPIRGAAVCMKTRDHTESLSAWKGGHQVRRATCPLEPVEVDYLGGAVMLIEREVIERLSEDESLRYEDPINGTGTHIFAEQIVDGALLSEDYSLCYRAREHGFSVWMDPAVIVTHHGMSAWRA